MSFNATLCRFKKGEKLVFPDNPFLSHIKEEYQQVIESYELEYPEGTPFVVACEIGDERSIGIIIRASQVAGIQVPATTPS